MRKHILAAALSATLSLAGTAALAQATPPPGTLTHAATGAPAGALDESAIKAHIAGAGYQEVKGLEFKDGVWQAKARGGNDKWTHIKVGPMTGKVYPSDAPSRLNKDEVKAKLTAQGFQNIGHVDFDDGLWSADAENAQGHDVDLLVDPDDGTVVAVNQD